MWRRRDVEAQRGQWRWQGSAAVQAARSHLLVEPKVVDVRLEAADLVAHEQHHLGVRHAPLDPRQRVRLVRVDRARVEDVPRAAAEAQAIVGTHWHPVAPPGHVGVGLFVSVLGEPVRTVDAGVGAQHVGQVGGAALVEAKDEEVGLAPQRRGEEEVEAPAGSSEARKGRAQAEHLWRAGATCCCARDAEAKALWNCAAHMSASQRVRFGGGSWKEEVTTLPQNYLAPLAPTGLTSRRAATATSSRPARLRASPSGRLR